MTTDIPMQNQLKKTDGWPRWLSRRVRLLWRAPLAHREAVRLAQVMWRRTYRDAAPHWQPLEDTAGVISQIDNMHAGVVEENERMRAALLHMANMPEYDQDDAHRLRHQAKLALSNAASETRLQRRTTLNP